MDETEAYIRAVESFAERQNPLSEELERFISYIAKTGDILAPWEKVQKVFVNKLHLVLDEFYESNPYKAGSVNANAVNDDFQEMKSRLTELTEEFDDPPFTIQRLCELLVDPRKNYTKCDKFMRGLEKNLMVVSSWNNLPRRASDASERVNGMVGTSNGYAPGSDRCNPHWANLPPSPISTTPPKIPGAPDFTAICFPKLDPPEAREETKDGEAELKSGQPMETDGVKEPEVKSSSEAEEGASSSSSPPIQSKPAISATIISSSPPTTINIKRKLDGTVVQVGKDDTDDAEEASPTKKLKQDEETTSSEPAADPVQSGTSKEENEDDPVKKNTEQENQKQTEVGDNDDSSKSETIKVDSSESNTEKDDSSKSETSEDDSTKNLVDKNKSAGDACEVPDSAKNTADAENTADPAKNITN